MKRVPQEKIGYGAKTGNGPGGLADKQVNGAQGLVIAIDGPDGVGKTTQLRLLAEYLRGKGTDVHTTRQSGGTPIGEELRKASLSRHERSPQTDLYISLAMAQALAEDITRHKKAGETILIDRSPLALIAYNGYGSRLPAIRTAFDACEQLFKQEQIDTLFYLDAAQNVLNKRRAKRGANDYFEKQNVAYHTRVREGYRAGLNFLKTHPEFGPKVMIIDASGSIAAIQQNIIGRLRGDARREN